MNTKVILLTLALGASTCLLTAQDNNPGPDNRPPLDRQGGPRGPEGGRMRGPSGPHLLPPRAHELLNLTPDQEKQVADLEAEVKATLEHILTPEQLKQLQQMRPPRGPGGAGRPPHPPQE